MPVELLKAIANKPLPLTVTNLADIDKLRVLRAAGCIAAMLPSPGTDQALARVLHITPKGREAMALAHVDQRELAAGQEVVDLPRNAPLFPRFSCLGSKPDDQLPA